MGAGLRPTPKGVELPPYPKVRAPVPHPTGDAVAGIVGGKHARYPATGSRVNGSTTNRAGSEVLG
jgi:hypothetical protein